MGGVWEGRITTLVLLIGGIAVVLLFLYWFSGIKLS